VGALGLLEFAWRLISDVDRLAAPPGWAAAVGQWHEGYEALLKTVTGVEGAPAEPESPAAAPRGRLANVEVKGFRDLGVVRVSEATLAGEPMLHAERTEWSSSGFRGDAADFPASSLHFITWLPDGALEDAPRAAIPAGRTRDDDDEDDGETGWPRDSVYDEAEREGGPF
jgi:hypothetical protein